MSIPEEIEQLKTRLDQTAGEQEQAEILLEICRKYATINSTAYQAYIDRLLHAAERLGAPRYRAWGLHYLAGVRQLTGDYDTAIHLIREALACFEQAGDKKGLATAHNTIGNIYNSQGKYDQALESCFAALKMQEELGDTQAMASTRNNIGIIYHRQGKYQEALENQYAALEVARGSSDKLRIAKYLNNIAVVYKSQGKYPESLENYFAALKVMAEIGNKSGMSNGYNNIGNIYYAQGKYPDALENLFAALRIRQEIGDKYGVAASLLNLGQAYAHMGKYPEALENYQASLRVSEELGARDMIATGQNGLAYAYAKMGNYQQALENQLAALKTSEETGSKERIADCYCGIGHSYIKLGYLATAHEVLMKGLDIAEAVGLSKVQKECCQQLYDLHKMTGRYQQALEYHEKYIDIAMKLENEETTKKMAGLEFDFKIDKKEQEVKFEREKKEALEVAYGLLEAENERSENLLLNILPSEVAKELKEKGSAGAKQFDAVTVLFTDFKSFTTVSERLTPQQLVDELHTCFSAFDGIMQRYGIEKIKTVGDAYLAVCGLPLANEAHAEQVIRAAIDIREYMLDRKKELGDMTFEIRIGVHSGSVVAGIVGVKKYAYDIWGDTVNTAARMEQNSEPGRINISETTYGLLKGLFTCTCRGEIEAKNKGKLKMYFVE